MTVKANVVGALRMVPKCNINENNQMSHETMRFAVSQTLEKDSQLTLILKTHEK